VLYWLLLCLVEFCFLASLELLSGASEDKAKRILQIMVMSCLPLFPPPQLNQVKFFAPIICNNGQRTSDIGHTDTLNVTTCVSVGSVRCWTLDGRQALSLKLLFMHIC